MIGYKENVLIAEFMGMESFKDSLASLHQGKINVDVDVYEQAQYHKSWDWLMPVCQQIDKYLEDNISLIGYFDECLTSNDLEVRFQAVVEFINQLNK
jgi:hypothetical protein